jgi:hypothetical protein
MGARWLSNQGGRRSRCVGQPSRHRAGRATLDRTPLVGRGAGRAPVRRLVAAAAALLVAGCGGSDGASGERSEAMDDQFHPVTPVTSSSSGQVPAASTAPLAIQRGQFFSYALPDGWRVGEDGQFALTLHAPDNRALTVMVGNAGLPVNYPPDRFVAEKLGALRPEGLRIGAPTPVEPGPGFTTAMQYEVDYSTGGVPVHGVVTCHVAPAYDTQVMAMTAALAAADQWPQYARWLPLVAAQVAASDGAAFGMRGVMAQNLQQSTAFAAAAREYREWSQRTWDQVTQERAASQERQNEEFRENLGAVQTYTNPYEGRPLELPTTYTHYWIDRQGHVVGTDNPTADPNVGSTGEWRRLPVVKR